jgi:hypothetical protein
MASNIQQFDLALKRWGDEMVPGRALQFQRAVCLEALRRVVLMSPVDKGRFRGNWQCSVGAPAAGVLEVEDKSGGPTITAGMVVVAALDRPGWFWIVNNVPYAVALERGHSRQAPAGVLAVTAEGLRAWLAAQ